MSIASLKVLHIYRKFNLLIYLISFIISFLNVFLISDMETLSKFWGMIHTFLLKRRQKLSS